MGEVGHQLLEQSDPFAADRKFEGDKAGNVALRMR
jgi:hypothetical protein